MRLWYMHSKVLKGFYKSEVYVVGANKEDAMQTGLQAYDQWLKQYIEEIGFHPLVTYWYDDDPDYKKEAAARRDEFYRELRSDLKQTKYRGQIEVVS